MNIAVIVASFVVGFVLGAVIATVFIAVALAGSLDFFGRLSARKAPPEPPPASLDDIREMLRLAQDRAGRLLAVVDEAAQFNEGNGDTWTQHRERLAQEFTDMRHFAATLLTQINCVAPLLEPGQTGKLRSVVKGMENKADDIAHH